MKDPPNSWKVVIVGPTGAALDGSAFGLLYSLPTREEAEEHAECFRHTGVKLALCDERENVVQFAQANTGSFPISPVEVVRA